MSLAHHLEGKKLDDGWTVLRRADRKPNATGGTFSVSYIVEHESGRQGFLKAIDYSVAFEPGMDTASTLHAMTRAYLFEVHLCEKTGHLSRVARAIGHGSVSDLKNRFNKVDYLIFELADGGDIRGLLDTMKTLDVAFLLRTLHHVATGLSQLHAEHIAHQDLKPSNVVCDKLAGSKICDLGRGWDQNHIGPHDNHPIAGDQTYAPIDLLYGEAPINDRARRFGCDLYHLGGLIVFLFSRVHINALINEYLQPDHWPYRWGGTYDAVLPFVQAAFDRALIRFSETVPDFLREELERIVWELCNPVAAKRGPIGRTAPNPYALEHYISRFDWLAHEVRLKVA
jgi:serine/threonine protein kinase